MYAIIRSGGKQAKVAEGDVIDVEKLRADDEVTFTPLLVVDDSGTVFSKRDDLAGAKVVARVVGDSAGPKIDIFKYKNKTGYRRRQGHRQKYTTIEITSIVAPGGKKKAAAKKAEDAEKPAAKKPAAKKPAAKKPAAKAEKPAADAKPAETDEEA
jgi:large subunit ribosomal protein L21